MATEPSTALADPQPKLLLVQLSHIYHWVVTRPGLGVFANVAVATAVLLVAVGCGGSLSKPAATSGAPDSAAGTSAGTMTRQMFLDKADAICATALSKSGSLPKPTSADPAAHLAYLRPLAEVLDEELNGLNAIPPPSGDEKKISLIIGSVKGEKGSVDAEIATLQQKDTPPDFMAKAIVVLEDGAATDAKILTQDAQDYGFTC